MCVLSPAPHPVTLGTVARQAPLSMGFSRQEYWSGLHFPSLEDILDPGIKAESPVSPALAGRSFITEPPGKLGPLYNHYTSSSLQNGLLCTSYTPR